MFQTTRFSNSAAWANRVKILSFGFLFASIFLMCFFSSFKSFARDAQSVVIGTGTNYPPYYSKNEDGTMVGFDIDIINAICVEVQLNCTFKNILWNQLIPSLLVERIDVIAAAHSITPERLNVIDFSRRYADTPIALVVRRGIINRSKISTDPLKGLTIGTQAGTIGDKYMQRYFADYNTIRIALGEDYPSKLIEKNVDVVLDDIAVLNAWLKTKEGQCCKLYKLLPIDREIQGGGLGFGVRKTDPELKALLDKGLNIILANGIYEKINKKYFDYTIYGK